MIKSSIIVAAGAAGLAFAVGCYVGWKTTLMVLDSALARRGKGQPEGK